MSKELIRTKDSVFVKVQPPESLQKVIDAKRQAKVWTKVATAIATETAEAIAAPQPAPRTPSPEDVRINRISPQGKHKRVYEGIYTEDLPERCQGHSDASGCLVEMHNATTRKVFHPETPIQNEDSPPISDKMKSEVEPKPSTYLQDLLAEVDRIMAVSS